MAAAPSARRAWCLSARRLHGLLTPHGSRRVLPAAWLTFRGSHKGGFYAEKWPNPFHRFFHCPRRSLAGRRCLELYDTNTLQRANELYSKNIRLVWTEDLLARLTPSEREAAGNVRLNIPLMGIGNHLRLLLLSQDREVTYRSCPSSFLMISPLPRPGSAAMGVQNIGIGLCGYPALPRSLPSAWNPLPPPLQALTIPQNPLKDPFVDDVSQKTLKSAIYFMMVHELGHVIYQHKPYYSINRPKAQPRRPKQMNLP